MNDVKEPQVDYKSTLNLPETAFPMQASLANREPERLRRWNEEDLYARLRRECAGRPTYWLVDGPPYANGDIHIGHAVNKVLKDIVVKSARLAGHDAAFIPGWDCHGLPIELQVEKKFGKVGEKLDAAAFRAKCREYAQQQIERQREDFKRLGILADWDRPYLTMDPAYEAEQLRALSRIVARGHVIRGHKPVHWCLDCGSSLAEAEVEYEDKTSPSIDVRFMAVDPDDLGQRFGLPPQDAGLVIWTTTPWTLPANQAITVHAELAYVLVDAGSQGKLVVAEGLLESFAQRVGIEARVLGRIPGRRLEGLQARHPFLDRVVPVILGEHVTLESGTGLVHTAPAHGVEDYLVGRQYGLPVNNPIANDGRFLPATPVVGGAHVRKADVLVIEALRAQGALVHLGETRHSYPHCWRHKTPLIFRATPQWFISMDAQGLRQDALEGIAATRWIPGWGQARIREMVAGRPDWCISRQRHWGVPLAVFVHRETGELHPRTPELLLQVADAVERRGLEAWFGSSAADWLGSEAADYEKGNDTLDVWFDSGVVHQGAFRTRAPDTLQDGVPPMADMYLEGTDQHRGWFMSSLLTSAAMYGRAPYKAVLTHGFTVDEQGRKMSKSLGNVIAPQQVTKTLGADVLRLWVAASDYSGEIALSDQLLQRTADAYRRIRNTMRFLLSNLNGFDPLRHAVPVEQLLPVDRWALLQAARLQEDIRQSYAEAQFHLVYHRLHNYCVVDLGGLYLDILKDRLYTMPADSLGRRSAQTTLFHLAEAMVRWIAPILSFTADEIWENLPGTRKGSVFSQTWHVLPAIPAEEVDWARLLEARGAVKKVLEDLRMQGAIGSGLDAVVSLRAEGALGEALGRVGEELRFWFITSGAALDAGAGEGVEVTLPSGERLGINARATEAPKCGRCWHRRSDVGKDPAHPALCARCVGNITDAAELRRFI